MNNICIVRKKYVFRYVSRESLQFLPGPGFSQLTQFKYIPFLILRAILGVKQQGNYLRYEAGN